jgi:hypothetical protein
MSHSQPQLHHQPNNNGNSRSHYGPNGFAKTNTFEVGRSSASEPGGGSWDPPLKGLRVVVIHVKDTFKDGPHVSESISEELNAYEQGLKEEGKGLGCEFVISKSGESYWF